MIRISRITTRCHRTAQRHWRLLGGTIELVRATGELRYRHAQYVDCIRVDGRRKDSPMALVVRLNALLKREAANDSKWSDEVSQHKL